METQQLGTCSRCGEKIFDRHVLITYEGDDGRRRWADCPSCGEIIAPE
jgi:DNA-directed RNA polymerase subunit RPC12/RpoP